MADTPTNGETASQGTVSNDVSQITAPATDNSVADQANLQKELEQLKMRNNQLANQLEEKRQAEEQARQKQLEEQEEFKTLYEQTQQQLDEVRRAEQERENRQKLSQATQDVLKDYPDNVRKLAEMAGLRLAEDTDEARNVLKEKLEAFKAEVAPTAGSSSRVTPNNPSTPAPNTEDRQALTAPGEGGSPSAMALAGARGDDSLAYKYIGTLPAIERMRQIARGE